MKKTGINRLKKSGLYVEDLSKTVFQLDASIISGGAIWCQCVDIYQYMPYYSVQKLNVSKFDEIWSRIWFKKSMKS
jgi:hypothetical protein